LTSCSYQTNQRQYSPYNYDKRVVWFLVDIMKYPQLHKGKVLFESKYMSSQIWIYGCLLLKVVCWMHNTAMSPQAWEGLTCSDWC
jgi:hypothetical protein